jgi:zinc transport system ATP-binding protein
MAQIKCADVTLAYEGHTVCEQLSFEIEKGDYVCIVGDNGSGKSTLMKALLSLKPVSKGSITLGDGLSRRDIGYLPQQSEAQKDFPASVEEVVISGCVSSLKGRFFMGRAERLEAVQNMKMMGVYELAKESYRNLSGGQQQRVLLARALCAAKSVLILDEPVSGLDPKATADMYGLIHHLNKHTGTTIIMVTHDIENSLRDATKVLRMGKQPEFFTSVEDFRKTLKDGGERE